jgi:hypothetical protein
MQGVFGGMLSVRPGGAGWRWIMEYLAQVISMAGGADPGIVSEFSEIQTVAGRDLPEDYKRLVSACGPLASTDRQLSIYDLSDRVGGVAQEFEELMGPIAYYADFFDYINIESKDGEKFVDSEVFLKADPRSIIPIGTFFNDHLALFCEPETGSWSVMVVAGSYWDQYEVGISEFLFKVFDGDVELPRSDGWPGADVRLEIDID